MTNFKTPLFVFLILAVQFIWLLIAPAFASLPSDVACLGGPLKSLTYGNGVTETRGFDTSYRPTGVADTGSSALSSLSYTLDAADNVSSIADNVSSANNQSFTYDGLDRLLTATGPYGALSWTLNSVGARQTQTLGANPADTYTDGEVLNKIVSGSLTTTMGYSGSTNLTAITPSTGSASTFVINRANRLASATIPGSAVETYTYDAFGNQFSRNPGTTQASAVEYSYGPGNVLLEESLNGAVQVNYLYLDGRPVSVQYPTSSTHDYIHTDRLGTPVLVTDPNKTKVWSASYRPYGEATSTGSIVQNLRMPGQFAGQVSGWYHNGARDYNPAWGQYVELDPLGLFAGPHPFTYALNNPLKYTDPSGLEPNPFEFACAAGPNPACLGGLALDAGTWLGTAVVGYDIGQAISEILTNKPVAPTGIVDCAKPPKDAKDLNGAKAPGKPGAEEGFNDPKGGEQWVKNPNGPGYGWLNDDGGVYVPTGWAGAPGTGTTGPAHGGPHWDVQYPGVVALMSIREEIEDEGGTMRTKLEATDVFYYSPNDEAAFFGWADKISCITRYYGVGKTVFFEVDARKISQQNVREILGLFSRYGVDLKQLAVLEKPRFSAWFTDPQKYWHKAVFGDSAS